MGPLLYDNYSSGPAIVLSPQSHHHYGQFAPRIPSNITPSPSHLSPFPMDDVRSASPKPFINHSTSWTPASASAPVHTNPSRKRSRDDASLANEYTNGENSFASARNASTQPTRPAVAEDQPIYG